MHRIRTFITGTLSTLPASNWYSSVLNATKSNNFLAPSSILPLTHQQIASVNTQSTTVTYLKDKFAERWYFIKEKVHYHLSAKYIYRRNAYALYQYNFDNLDYLKFMKDHKMPDTFYSWFLVTELHVWMLMVRLMASGKDGIHMRYNLVHAMWNDVDMRKKKLGNLNTVAVQDQVKLMGQQFTAAITGYDEGMQGSDVALAGAVWRRILQMDCDDPELVEKVVKYIRQTLHELDKLPHEVFTLAAKFKWVDYRLTDDLRIKR